jgi:radical SAM protein with 4Fe4S-binding SPASM domain
MKKIKKEKINGCGSIWRNEMIHITHNGDAALCCMDWRREIILGNLNQDTIQTIWNSEKRIGIERMVSGKIPSPENFICKRCEESL